MLVAAVTLCFCFFLGFLHSGEIIIPSRKSFDRIYHLTWNIFVVDDHANPTLMQVALTGSETNPFHQGSVVVVGQIRNKLGPMAALRTYMDPRGMGGSPFFWFEDGSPLTWPIFVTRIKEVLEGYGYPSTKYSGHGFWAEAATTAASEGIEHSTSQTLGRWKSCTYFTFGSRGNDWVMFQTTWQDTSDPLGTLWDRCVIHRFIVFVVLGIYLSSYIYQFQ